MECMGFEPAAAGWWAQTKPRSYDRRHFKGFYVCKNERLTSTMETASAIWTRNPLQMNTGE